jgi:hypothetical protein
MCSRGLLPGCIHLLNKADQTRDIENAGGIETKAKAASPIEMSRSKFFISG